MELTALNMKMKRPTWGLFGVVTIFCAIGWQLLVLRTTDTQDSPGSEHLNNSAWFGESFPGSCTTFASSYSDNMFFGNNEDFNNPDTYLWTIPSGSDTYGGVYFGYRYRYPQGGINEKGLAFDALALPEVSLTPHPGLTPAGYSATQFWGKILSQSSTVAEAINMIGSYNLGESLSYQVLLADVGGDAVIIGAGPDGDLAFTRKPEGDGYLIGTNFNRANPDNRFGDYPGWRYESADAKLAQIEGQAGLNVGYFQTILDDVHVEGPDQNTLYSNIFDLRNGVIHLYYWHQYDEVVTLNVAEKIEKGIPPTRLSDLFSQKIVERAAGEHQQYLTRAARDAWLNQYAKLIIIGAFLIILCLVVLLIYSFSRRKNHVRKFQQPVLYQ
jgi:hypothetical protein